MSEYKPHYTEEQKRQKIARFNDVYYNGDPDDWKVARLPDWMYFYGQSLQMRLDHKEPEYYRCFKQGTIVMINYGVTVGSELGGYHFGVVLSNNDTKYKSKIIVAPLSSKRHRGAVDLGMDLFESGVKFTQQRIKELHDNNLQYQKRYAAFIKKLNNQSEHVKLQEDIASSTSRNPLSDIELELKAINMLEDKVQDLKKNDAYKNNKGFADKVNNQEKLLKEIKSLVKQIRKIVQNTIKLAELHTKLQKYNKQSFVAVSDINAISKLKITKLSKYSLTGHVQISPRSLNAIQMALIRLID